MKQTQNQKGFTLIEVLIAAVIISFGMLAMGTFLGNYMNMNTLNERRTNATIAAQEKIEELRTLALTETLLSTDPDHQNLTGEALDNGLTRFWRIADDTADPKQIDVLVSWDGTNTSNNNVSFSTLVNNDAP